LSSAKTSEEIQAGICGIMTSILVWIYLVGMTTKGGRKGDRKAGRKGMSYKSSGEVKHTQRTEAVRAMREETF
jgi:hypothetical protein